ncbi:STAS domain-containing protein [Stenotrophomonas mori]|uniref:STAS domain-containing protein n=1 Tax=Stenotrophomonas mori TaxID=2871096 RepID=UPI002020BC05
MAGDASARVQDGTLHLTGTLDRAAATRLWPQLLGQAARLRHLDLGAVERVDSAGVALLAELAARIRANGHAATLSGSPAGLEELCAAYRLAPGLDYNAAPGAH